MHNQKFVSFALRIFLVMALTCIGHMTSYAQISISLKNGSVREAVERLQKEYKYSFTISTDEVDINKTISVDIKDAPMQKVLEQIFKGQNVDYRVEGKNVIVKGKPAPKTDAPPCQTSAAYIQRYYIGPGQDADSGSRRTHQRHKPGSCGIA